MAIHKVVGSLTRGIFYLSKGIPVAVESTVGAFGQAAAGLRRTLCTRFQRVG